MSGPYRQSNAARAVIVALAVAVVVAAAAWLVVSPQRQTGGFEQAGSEQFFAPVGPYRLVAATDPLSPGQQQIQGYVKDPATIPDSRISVDVIQKLQEMNLPVEPLDIRVEDRRVRLEGGVEGRVMRDAIEVTVRSVDGVREVDNRIEILGD
ncbi:MAG: BON domain-containing protein [Persicimonas sp.]